jgi:hypothetical protein
MSRAKVNKMKILRAVFKEDFNPDNYMHSHHEVPDSKFKRAFEQFKVGLRYVLMQKGSGS